MRRFAEAAEAIAAITKKNEKVRILADYLRSRTVAEAALSAVFFSGRPFPAWEETTLQAGGALLVRAVLEASGLPEAALENAYRKTGDLGAAAYEVLCAGRALRRVPHPSPERVPHPDPERSGEEGSGFPSAPALTLREVEKTFRAIAAARGPAMKAALLRRLLERAAPLEAKYLVKIVTGDLRIGLKESLVEEAIAAAYGEPQTREDRSELLRSPDRPLSGVERVASSPVVPVQRANMLLGDIGAALALAADHQLGAARMRLFHPLGFMLASPVETAEEAFEFFPHAQVEDKYDGIRAQAHCAGGEVRLFSRTLDDVTHSFPELVEPLAAFDGVILDGEIVAWDFARGHALPFSELQKRLGRKKVTTAMMRAVPVAYAVFDVLYAEGELAIGQTLRQRGALLDRLFAAGGPSAGGPPWSLPTLERQVGKTHRARVRAQDAQGQLAFEPAVVSDNVGSDKEPAAVIRAPVLRADSAEELEKLFSRAQARGNEGLMIKDLESVYTPGRRGRSWLKLKRELATLDVVVTSVEWGHGKRIGVLSDYTFAVRDLHPSSPREDVPSTAAGDPLLNVGKAYSGLTDREIAEMTAWFLAHTVADHGFWREVEPRIVVEVAFNAVMRSDRHNSGYALRFPRILRLRPDKSPEDADTLDRLQEIYRRQQLPKSA